MMFTKLLNSFQYLVPHHALSRLMGKLANCRWRWFKNLFITIFIKIYDVDMREAIDPNSKNYPDFNSFFTRALKPQARPIVQAENEIAFPTDGYISQIGLIANENIFQAKNHHYNLKSLLADSAELTCLFQNGNFATLYLAPKNYHRVHMPLPGKLQKMIYVPGELFSVNPRTVDHVPNLFARNERVITIFETAAGPMAIILVGAMIVGSIETVWAGEVTSSQSRQINLWNYDDGIRLNRGEEMGRFKMGSTVILLFGKDRITWEKNLSPNQEIKLGQLMGNSDVYHS